jgi:diaminohydroxyphosphoribosylaminopyrimidine deaminase/5-amino-6-(5-phosphoribosylamino)uracil reductase
VVDSRARLPLDSRLVKAARENPVILATTEKAPREALKKLSRKGVDIIEVKSRYGRVDLKALVQRLGEEEVTNVLIEGGGELLASAFSAGLVDRVIVFVAPKIFGGKRARTPVEGKGIEKVVEALPIKYTKFFSIGEDIVIEGEVLHHSSSEM